MHELERIENALRDADLDPSVFERCAQDLLTEIYPGLSPIPGGTDFGRDADVHGGGSDSPPRLMITKSRDYDEIRSNMIGGLKSLRKNQEPFDHIVLANPGSLSATYQRKLQDEAAKFGARVTDIFGRGFFASRLRRDGEWRSRLLGLSADPITLSRVPWQLAESVWNDELPLVGRDDLLATLSSLGGDVLLVGRPGVGKTRLLAGLTDAMFVDPDPAADRLVEDLRWFKPSILIVDDNARTPELLELIRRIRRQEADWLSMRLIVVCWPDEVEELRPAVQGSTEVEVELLERSEIDAIIRAMGVTGHMARQEILDQAEGRPGWAVAVTDLLLRSGWEGLLTGQSLLSQVQGYLRRSQQSDSARDLLATIAALGGVEEAELKRLADTVQIKRTDVGRQLRTVADGGLIDVAQHRERTGIRRYYSVRPPMLAEAIATEHFFGGDATLGDFADVLERWPDRTSELLITACTAARLGSEVARAMVDGLVEAHREQLDPAETRSVFHAYALIDSRTGERVVEWLKAELDDMNDAVKADGFRLQPLVEAAYLVAARHRAKSAVRLLLDVAAFDERSTNPHADHPLRKLADLAGRVHPDFEMTNDDRALVAEVLDQNTPTEPSNAEWTVWSTVAQAMLDPHARGAYSSPEIPRTISLIEQVVPPELSLFIYEQLWPTVRNRLASAPTTVLVDFSNLVHSWLRIGGGYDHPFGNDHPEDAIEQIKAAGEGILGDLAALCPGRPALACRLAETAKMFGIDLPADAMAEVADSPFYRDFERPSDWRAAAEQLDKDIARDVEGWDLTDPSPIVERLAHLRDELSLAKLDWPDRVLLACQAIAASVDDLAVWIDAALDGGLSSHAGAFLEPLVTSGSNSAPALIKRCLDDSRARPAALSAALTLTDDPALVTLGIHSLEGRDFGLLDVLVIRDQLSLDVQRRVLTEATPEAQGVFVVALAGRTEDPTKAIPKEIETEVLAAALEIRPALLRHDSYQLIHLIEILASRHPQTLEQLVVRWLTEATAVSRFDVLSPDVWGSLSELPRANRTSLYRQIRPTAIGSDPYLLESLTGSDVGWLEELLENDLLTPMEALGAKRFNGATPLDELAKLLIPRGVAAERIADLAILGTSWGEASERYGRLVDQFAGFAAQDDPDVRALGEAGVEMYSKARDDALRSERRNRILGRM